MTTTATQQIVPVGTWKSDPVHSHAGFSVKHMAVGTFRGSFGSFDATLTAAEEGEPRLVGSVPVESVEVKDENLIAHLLSPDFFDAERHPEITFVSAAIRPDGDEMVVEGELTIKGTARAVKARGTITDAVDLGDRGERIGLDLETTVDRTDFGLNWNAPLPKGGLTLGNDVTLTIHLELAKEA